MFFFFWSGIHYLFNIIVIFLRQRLNWIQNYCVLLFSKGKTMLQSASAWYSNTRVWTTVEECQAYRRRGQVDRGPPTLLRANTGVAPDGETASGRAAGTWGTRGRNANFGSHEGVVAQAAVGESVGDS